MAASTRRSVGRPKLPGCLKTIRLRDSVFNLWRVRKEAIGFENKTDSEFAEFLLHQRRTTDAVNTEENLSISVEEDCTGPLAAPLFSTPIRAIHSKTSYVDVTGNTSSFFQPAGTSDITKINGSVMFAGSVVNEDFNSVQGNPYSVFIDSDDSSHHAIVSDSLDVSEDSEDSEDDVEFSLSMAPVLVNLTSYNYPETESGDCSDDESTIFSGHESDTEPKTVLEVEDMDISESCLDDERTITIIDMGDSDEIMEDQPLVHIPHSEDSVTPNANVPPSPASKLVEENTEEIIEKMEAAFTKLTKLDGLEEFVRLQKRSRYIISKDKLEELVGSTCVEQTNDGRCGAELTFESKALGSSLELTWHCQSGHSRKWVSSESLPTNKRGTISLNDSMLASAVIISGNNYAKFNLLCKALGLQVISEASFLRFQKHCAAPVIEEIWAEMNEMVKQIFQDYEEVCLCGDGRNDSPGHSARYCVYTLVEHFTSAVLDFSVIDKRETGGNSTTMEKEALKRLLEKLAVSFPFQELVTDASPTVIKLVKDLKEYPQLMALFHSLDIWHKAKKLSKSLHQAAKIKGCSELKEWIEPVVNHFWFCSQMSEGSEERLKDTWQGVLHHVCGEHEWAEGKCEHDDIDAGESGRKYMAKDCKAMAALRKIILDPKWLKSLHYYVRFRHTSILESYNSMMTKYVPKRMAFEYVYFIMRVTLAAMDHNFHLSRKPAKTQDGATRGHRKYSKRSQKFHAEVVKEEKSYSYFPFLLCKMLQRRAQMEGSFSQPADKNKFNPKQIAPTLGMKEAPPTEILMKGPSRFLKK